MTAADHVMPSAARPEPAHEHAWVGESSHATSEGRIVYVRCGGCGTRRVDRQHHAESPPYAVSVELGGAPGSMRARPAADRQAPSIST